MKPLRMLLVQTRDPGRHRTLSHVDIARIRPGIQTIGERTDIIIPPGIIRQETIERNTLRTIHVIARTMGSGCPFSTIPIIPGHVVATGKSLVAVSKTEIDRRFRLASERRECNYIQQEQQRRTGTNQNFCFHTYCF